MKHAFAVLALFLLAASVPAAPPDVITLPVIPKPDPAPKPDPNAVPKLTTGLYFVVSYSEDQLLFGSPTGFVNVVKEKGPIRLRGQFVGGKGVETRSFAGPFVYIFETAKKGREELIFVPKKGIADEKEAYRQLLDSDPGEPTPPTPPVPPVPPAPADVLLGPVQAAYSADPSPTKAADTAMLAAVYRSNAQSANDPAVKTEADFYSVLTNTRAKKIADRLHPVRVIFGTELGKYLATDGTSLLTTDQRAAAAAQLNRFADILGGLR